MTKSLISLRKAFSVCLFVIANPHKHPSGPKQIQSTRTSGTDTAQLFRGQLAQALSICTSGQDENGECGPDWGQNRFDSWVMLTSFLSFVISTGF